MLEFSRMGVLAHVAFGSCCFWLGILVDSWQDYGLGTCRLWKCYKTIVWSVELSRMSLDISRMVVRLWEDHRIILGWVRLVIFI